MREITQHEFRHSYTTRQLRKGVPIDSISKSMGHSNTSTTLNIYSHNEKRTLSAPIPQQVSLILKFEPRI